MSKNVVVWLYGEYIPQVLMLYLYQSYTIVLFYPVFEKFDIVTMTLTYIC